MTNLRELKSETLLQKTKDLVREERQITLELIDHLREIEARMLFAELGYGSLFEFAVKHLGLSEGSAHRRIASMRLVRDTPAAQEALRTGKLTLSNAAKLHVTFRAHHKLARKGEAKQLPEFEKEQIISSLAGLSQRECETKLADVLPAASSKLNLERTRVVSASQMEIKLVVSNEFEMKLSRLKELDSHRLQKTSIADVLENLIDLEIKRLEKTKGLIEEKKPIQNTAAVRTEKFPSSTRRHLPAELRRTVWKRANGGCQYPGCGSRTRLEIDHIVPRALGGLDSPENLRLLCRTHNIHQARRKLGDSVMGKFVLT